MSIIRKNSRKYLIELVITLVVTGAIIFGVSYKLYGEAMRLKAIRAESQMRRTMRTAYDISGDLERQGKLRDTRAN